MQISRGGCLVLLAASACLWLQAGAFAQTASQITPPSFRPAPQANAAGVSIPESSGLEAPAGAEKLKVKLSGVSVEGGLPEMADATRKITAGLAHRTVTAAQIFAAARQIETEYGRAGYALVRAVLPAQNYDITYVEADFSIAKRAITVVAGAQSRRQDTANAPLTYTIGGLGLVNGDMLTGVLSTDATTQSAPGRYAIQQGSLGASANYELTYVGSDLVVLPTNDVPPAGTASIVAYNAIGHGGGQPAPVFFTGQVVDGDTQTLVEDPRFDGPAFCQSLGDSASVCAVASVQ